MPQLSKRAHPVLAEDGGAVLNARTGRWTHLTPTAAAAVMAMCCTNTEDEAAEQSVCGRRLTWCLGVRFSPAPTEYHAWVEVPGHGPVGENTDTGWHYHTALHI